MYKKVMKITKALLISTVLFTNVFSVNTAFAASRDCDGNALIYCGTLSKSELRDKLTNGTGKQYQSGGELKALFARVGFEMGDIDSLQEGRVTKTNQAYVGNTLVASNVYTFGRHNISGSTRVNDVPYPLYKRHPQVSFLSSSISAYVYTNYDGSMAYAILKTCGNIVEGVGKRAAPPPPTPAPVRVSLTIHKFEDLNSNSIQDTDELSLAGWNFRISGGGVQRVAVTDNNGQAIVSDLPEGIYVVTEVLQTGWNSTTGLTKSHLVNADPTTQQFIFGNAKIPEEVTEGGGETLVLPAVLPTVGLVEDIAIVVALIVSLSLLAYFGTRMYLKRTLRGEKPPTNPKDLIKELRKRAKERGMNKK